MRIYPSRSHDPKKNPYDPDEKIDVMKQMYPDHMGNIVNDPNSKTIFDVLKRRLMKMDFQVLKLWSVVTGLKSSPSCRGTIMENSMIFLTWRLYHW